MWSHIFDFGRIFLSFSFFFEGGGLLLSRCCLRGGGCEAGGVQCARGGQTPVKEPHCFHIICSVLAYWISEDTEP